MERLATFVLHQAPREDTVSIRAACLIVFATCAGFVVASVLRANVRGETKRVHKAQIHEWENEGGSLPGAPSRVASSVPHKQW